MAIELFDVLLYGGISVFVFMVFKMGPKTLSNVIGAVFKSQPLVWDYRTYRSGRLATTGQTDNGLTHFTLFKNPVTMYPLPPVHPRQIIHRTYPHETLQPEGLIIILPEIGSDSHGVIERHLMSELDELDFSNKKMKAQLVAMRKAMESEESVSAAKAMLDSGLRMFDEHMDKYSRVQVKAKRQVQLLDAARGGKKGEQGINTQTDEAM